MAFSNSANASKAAGADKNFGTFPQTMVLLCFHVNSYHSLPEALGIKKRAVGLKNLLVGLLALLLNFFVVFRSNCSAECRGDNEKNYQ